MQFSVGVFIGKDMLPICGACPLCFFVGWVKRRLASMPAFCHRLGKLLPPHWQSFAIAMAKCCQHGGKNRAKDAAVAEYTKQIRKHPYEYDSTKYCMKFHVPVPYSFLFLPRLQSLSADVVHQGVKRLWGNETLQCF